MSPNEFFFRLLYRWDARPHQSFVKVQRGEKHPVLFAARMASAFAPTPLSARPRDLAVANLIVQPRARPAGRVIEGMHVVQEALVKRIGGIDIRVAIGGD